MKTIEFDPKIFISPPYWKCPNCNASESFGVLMVRNNFYIRRCKECRYDLQYSLPKLNKKVIYIDQFVISNMMKSLNPETKAHQKGTLDSFWLRLFEKLQSLCKLQLIICPNSGFHTDESLLSPYYKPLKRMYELLSAGISFYDHETIKRFQIHEHAKNWISGKPEKVPNLDIHSVVHGNINAWQNRFIVSVNLQYGKDCTNDLRENREKICEGLSEVFNRWKSEKNKTFDDCFEEESMTFGRLALQIYLNYLKRSTEISLGHIEISANDIFPQPAVIMIREVQDVFKEVGILGSDIMQKTVEYLTSPSLKHVPFIRISSMLWASLARKATSGRKKPPNQGMANDIEIISVLLPYCDAVFIDKECHSYLKEKPLCDSIDCGTKIFSLENKEEFLEYLNGIETKTSKEHLNKINEVYGERWKEPYTTLYKEKQQL